MILPSTRAFAIFSRAEVRVLWKVGCDIPMAGVNGRFAIEDFLGAGEIISNLQDQELDELALASVLASQNKKAVNEAVKNSKSAQGLYELGLGEDVDFCLKRNLYDTVPVYKNGKVRRNL